MKPLLLILLVLIQGVAYAEVAYASDDKPEIGRYQLLYAVTETSGGPGGTYQSKTVWKIDTVTGQVWQFVSTTIKGQVKESFLPVETREP
jgi:hypothetical protein